MTREGFALAIHWNWIITFAGVVNVIAQLPQTRKLVMTHSSKGLALPMFCIYLFTQVAFSVNGYLLRDMIQFVTLGLSAIISIINISLILKYRP